MKIIQDNKQDRHLVPQRGRKKRNVNFDGSRPYKKLSGIIMEQAKRDTPSKVQRVDSPLINNLWMHRTPVKQNEMKSRRAPETHSQSNAQSLPFTGLPTHITPPSKLRKLITKNPFEPDLINKLHLPVISPTVFAKVSSPMQDSPGFKWNIDELAHIKPVKIEEFLEHQADSPDPELEIKAQAAIDRFFKQNHLVPSPWDVRQKESKPSLDTPNRPLDDLNSTKDFSKSKKDVWSQTVLSLPFHLPQNVQEALEPFFTFTQEQGTDGDDINLSNNSLRRKLFSNHDECTDNDSFISLSPVKTNNSMRLSCSPPQSGIFVHGTPLKKLLQTGQNNKSSEVKSKSVSPPDMSPIHTENNVLYEKIARSSRSAMRLDFTMDMSIDNVAVEKSENSMNDISLDENNVKRTEDNHEIIIHNDKTNICDSINMEELPSCINSVDTNTIYFDAILFNDKRDNNDMDIKIKTEIQSSTQESHKQNNAMFNTFDQQSISNLVQDTGYQTYSMNSTMHTVDSYSNTSVSKTRWNERQVTSRDNNTQLSWRENIENVFSSTPSKCNKN